MTYFITIHLNFNEDLPQFQTKMRTAVKKIAQVELMGIFFLRYYGVYWFTRTQNKLSFTFFLQNSHYHQTRYYICTAQLRVNKYLVFDIWTKYRQFINW